MTTINISLPDQLKAQSQQLIEAGFYASMSDLVRSALRTTLSISELELIEQQAIDDHRAGKSIVLKTKKDIDAYTNSL